MAIFNRKSANAHWSKDYIEHLRTVHLALIIVAVTGIMIARSPDLSEMHAAQRQLHDLASFASQRPEPQRQEKSKDESLTNKDWITFEYKGKRYATEAIVTNEWHRFIKIGNCPFIPPPGTSDYSDRIPAAVTSNYFQMTTTVGEFADLWDFFYCAGVVDSVVVETGAKLLAGNNQKIDFTVVKATELEISKSATLLNKTFDTAFVSENLFNEVGFVEVPGTPRSATGAVTTGGLEIGNSLLLPVHLRDIPSLDKLPSKGTALFLSGPHFLHSCGETFEKCFPYLAIAVKKNPNDDWKALEAWMDLQITQAQGRQFEIFGVKPPPADQSYWAILAVLAVLSYFWLHLQQLSPKLSPSDPGLEVAWVGLYPSFVAYGLVWLTVLILPVTAVLSLIGRGAPSNSWVTHSLDGIAVSVSFFLSWASCICLYKLSNLASNARTETKSALETHVDGLPSTERMETKSIPETGLDDSPQTGPPHP